jgi:hypothetical protein
VAMMFRILPSNKNAARWQVRRLRSFSRFQDICGVKNFGPVGKSGR